MLKIWACFGAEMVNVEYIHKVIEQQWDISIPYNPKLENPKFAANMKYLLTAVDVANEMLNGEKTTDYGNSEYATMYAADTIATNDAVARLIKKEKSYPFIITTTPDTSSFGFVMSAKGEFVVDWGDGQTETITRDNTDNMGYSHDYATAGEYKIGIGGQATEYSPYDYIAAISFYDYDGYSQYFVASIDGSLGAIFPTIGDGSAPGQQPRFYETFMRSQNLSGSIPENLFTGVHGAPVPYMFYGTFNNCFNLSGKIPEKLFAGISGAPAEYMFSGTFMDCDGLTEIPGDLFAGIQGAPANRMFYGTFVGCTALTEIPSGLFAGISGAPAEYMFYYTFGSTGINEIPSDLFGDISGYAERGMFVGTFYSCSNLTGPSAKIGDKYLYEIWPDVGGSKCYYLATGLSDYDDIPSNWK